MINMLLIDGVKYKLWTPKDEEKEFHPIIREHSRLIFGEASVYFDIKQKLTAKSGIASIPDAYVITVSKPYRWYIVENELSTHPVYSHIVPQISKFITGIENLASQREIRDILYDEIDKNKLLRAYIETEIGSEIHRFLSDLLAEPPSIVIVIDQLTDEVREVCRFLDKFDTHVIEFQTFVRDDAETVHAHLFEPLQVGPITRAEKKEGIKRPEYYENWEKRLGWVNNETRTLVSQLISAIKNEVPDVNHLPRYRWYYFYKGKSRGLDSLFAVLMLTRKSVKVRIKVDPSKFKDERNWTKQYKGWFFARKWQEREFSLTSPDQLPYALQLIKQSHDISQ
jgi:predicted transport protein